MTDEKKKFKGDIIAQSCCRMANKVLSTGMRWIGRSFTPSRLGMAQWLALPTPSSCSWAPPDPLTAKQRQGGTRLDQIHREARMAKRRNYPLNGSNDDHPRRALTAFRRSKTRIQTTPLPSSPPLCQAIDCTGRLAASV